MIPKPKRKPKSKREPNPQKQQRIVDPKAIEAARRPYCVYCGLAKSDIKYEVHHINKRSQGGDDVPENLISLCTGPGSKCCHERAEGQTVVINKERYEPIKKKDLIDMLEPDRKRWEGGE